MRICKLTILAQLLNSALGSGRFHDITYDEVWSHIEDGTIFQFLTERIGAGVTLSVLGPADRLELLMEWENMHTCVEPYRFNGHRNGLCLLVGYMLQGIANRASSDGYRLTTERCGAVVDGGRRDRLS